MNISTILAEYRGLYARVAARAGVDASYVSRIADGTRRNKKVKSLLIEELKKVHGATEGFLTWHSKINGNGDRSRSKNQFTTGSSSPSVTVPAE